MERRDRTLVLAGAREAHGIVAGLVSRGRSVLASMPEMMRGFDPLPVPTRVGRFNSPRAFEQWLDAQLVGTVIDASHAFETKISLMAEAAAHAVGRRYLRVLRPPWSPTPQDRWKSVRSVAQAAQALPADARAFSNTGWLSLPEYGQFAGETLFLRQTHPNTDPPPFPFVQIVEGQPPFKQGEEQRLFQDLGVTHLICRNVGGTASMSKLLAARTLSLPVLMIERAPLPAHWQRVETVAEALAWEADG